MECFRLLFDNLAWIEHQFLSGIRGSRKAGRLWGMMRGVRGVRKSIHHSWLAKGFGLGLLCWGFKGAQEEILSKEASTLQIGSVTFPPGQCTSPQHHPCHRLYCIWCRKSIVLKTLHIHQCLFVCLSYHFLSQKSQNISQNISGIQIDQIPGQPITSQVPMV